MVLLAGIVLVMTKAAGFFASAEPDTGTLTSNAKIINDAGASGGQAVQFTAPPQGGGSALTSRPNDGSGYWPDFSNTGYKNTPANAGGLGLPAYPGSLTDYASGMSTTKLITATYPDNSVISYKHFVGDKILIYGDNLTFIGCLFEGKKPDDNLVQIYSPHKIKFLYSTFKPIGFNTPPGNNGTVSSSRTSTLAPAPPYTPEQMAKFDNTPYSESWQYMTTMQESVVTMDHNDIWGNAGLEMVTGFPGNPSTWTNNYIHDQADTARSQYHHDGIGPQSEGNGGPMLIDHNTIASIGNTNAIALQGNGVYDHVSITNNYISGWGYAISIGITNNATNATVTGNIFSAELKQLFGFLYGNFWGGTARGSTWRNNMYQVRAGDSNSMFSTGDNGKYAWPTDNSSHAADYGG